MPSLEGIMELIQTLDFLFSKSITGYVLLVHNGMGIGWLIDVVVVLLKSYNLTDISFKIR